MAKNEKKPAKYRGELISEIDDSELFLLMKQTRGLVFIMLPFGILCSGVLFIQKLTERYTIKTFSDFLFPLILLLVCLLASIPHFINLKKFNTEISNRNIPDEIKAKAGREYKVFVKRVVSLVVICMLIVAALVLILCWDDITYSAPTSKPKAYCKACDTIYTDSENRKSIIETNMCENCYNNFKSVEWVLTEDYLTAQP